MKLPSKTMPIHFSRLKSFSLHKWLLDNQYTLFGNKNKKKKLRALKPIFPFSAVKSSHTLFYITYQTIRTTCITEKLNPWYFLTATIQVSFWQATLESLSTELQAFPPAVTSINNVFYLHPWEKKNLQNANKGLRKTLVDKSVTMIFKNNHSQQAY